MYLDLCIYVRTCVYIVIQADLCSSMFCICIFCFYLFMFDRAYVYMHESIYLYLALPDFFQQVRGKSPDICICFGFLEPHNNNQGNYIVVGGGIKGGKAREGWRWI